MPKRLKPLPLPTGRVDERDTMFARAARRRGTPPYEEYYSRHSELKRIDDRLRALPPLAEPGGTFFDPVVCAEARRLFDQIAEIRPDKSFVRAWQEAFTSTSDPKSTAKRMIRALGAVAMGCTDLPEAFVYTHKGRLDQDYGHEIHLDHPKALVFLVEMDYAQMRRAPRAEALRESARQYYRAAVIAKTATAVLQAAGYAAKAHYDAHYDVILPPLAVRAGLGELGRNNILVADRYGSRVRIGAVTTDLPVEPDQPISLGVGSFCEICKKCAENCPSRALSLGEKAPIRDLPRWPTDVERCYNLWRVVGSDCGICMAVCPFSHRTNAFHNLVRWVVKTMPGLRRFALYCDDLLYGRRWKTSR